LTHEAYSFISLGADSNTILLQTNLSAAQRLRVRMGVTVKATLALGAILNKEIVEIRCSEISSI